MGLVIGVGVFRGPAADFSNFIPVRSENKETGKSMQTTLHEVPDLKHEKTRTSHESQCTATIQGSSKKNFIIACKEVQP